MIIGLVGRTRAPNGMSSMGAGKSTVANMLVHIHNFQEIALADPLKRYCAEVFGMSADQLWGPSELRETPNAHGVSPREALQKLGTEWGRSLDENVWVRYGVEVAWDIIGGYCDYSPEQGRISGVSAKRGGVVFSDIRFKNEIAYLKDSGAKIVLVERTVDHDIQLSTHQSEVDLNSMEDFWDMKIVNHGASMETLQATVSHVYERLLVS